MNRAKPLILNVDDDEAGRYAVGRILRQNGYEVMDAATGGMGLELAEKHQPDLVLLDIRLPDIDGFEVCRRIRQNAALAGTPIIQMSASYLDATSKVKGLENGADGYLTEPVEPAVLTATIHSLLRMKKAEQTVRQSALQWQSTFNAIREGVALLNGEGAVLQCNEAFRKTAGPDGANIREAIIGGFTQLRATRERQTDEFVSGETTLLITLDPVLNQKGEFDGGVCVVADITEKKRFDQQMHQTAKLESIGVLAGGIAHDFNNLLTGILGNSSLLTEKFHASTPEGIMAREIVLASESAADLTRQILAYSGKGRFLMKPVDLSSIALESRAFVRRFIPVRVELIYNLMPDIPMVHADTGQMQQLTMNLIINAAESFGETQKGTVRVETRVEHLGPDFFLAGETPAPGEYVSLVVSDNGTGMDKETQARIFDPFFTTKFVGRGLGLSAVHGILQGHHGFMRLESKPGEGTTFRLYFPAAREARPNAAAPGTGKPGQGSGTILVVDDEGVVRKFAQAALENRGYRVLLAENGMEGVKTFRAAHKRINLVLLDLTMPAMSGEEALDQLRSISRNVPVILSSGFSQEVAVERFRGKGLAGFLGKPYTGSQLSEAVEIAMRSQ